MRRVGWPLGCYNLLYNPVIAAIHLPLCSDRQYQLHPSPAAIASGVCLVRRVVCSLRAARLPFEFKCRRCSCYLSGDGCIGGRRPHLPVDPLVSRQPPWVQVRQKSSLVSKELAPPSSASTPLIIAAIAAPSAVSALLPCTCMNAVHHTAVCLL
jgi:hypothetical protein